MFRAIARYGARSVPNTTWTLAKTLAAGEAASGSSIREFEEKFAAYQGVRHAIATSYGRMAFFYILRALELPEGSEILFPALTFWVVPEMARVSGCRPVFVDIDPATYNIDPSNIEPAVTERTRAIVPTHLYGQPCDMDPLMEIARRHDLLVIEDCAHALGATYRGAKAGTFGQAAFFSFQLLKPLNTYGGGMATTHDDRLGRRIRELAETEPWPSTPEVLLKLLSGYLQRLFISPYGFTCGLFPALYIGSFFGHRDLTQYVWEKIRPLEPRPPSYHRRYANAQAAVGLKALAALDEHNARSQAHARLLSEGLKDARSITPPVVLPEVSSVYYQYCVRASEPVTLSRRALRQGVDMEMMHVDVCNRLALFAPYASSCPVAESMEGALQLPVYSGLRPGNVERILQVIKEVSHDLPPLGEPAPAVGDLI